jgi:Prenyltransferase and squalene oxidase repeat
MTERPMIFDAAARHLLDARNDDGGFGPGAAVPSEPEPTALAAIALADERARSWLERRQRDDGSFGVVDGFVRDEAATGLAAIAVGPGPARERALDRLEALEAVRVASTDAIPVDPNLPGWPWMGGTAGWVDPTASSLLALRLLRPESPRIADAVGFLRERRCVDGGWNYGNRVVLDEELPPYAHTTALALVALRGLEPTLEAEGGRQLRSLWRRERAGALSLAVALTAFELRGERDEADAVATALHDLVEGTDLLGDAVVAGWAALACGPGLEVLGAP